MDLPKQQLLRNLTSYCDETFDSICAVLVTQLFQGKHSPKAEWSFTNVATANYFEKNYSRILKGWALSNEMEMIIQINYHYTIQPRGEFYLVPLSDSTLSKLWRTVRGYFRTN